MTEYNAARNQRWANRYHNMEERDALVARSEGLEMEEKLKAAREKYFTASFLDPEFEKSSFSFIF